LILIYLNMSKGFTSNQPIVLG